MIQRFLTYLIAAMERAGLVTTSDDLAALLGVI